jgi:hypothetical protein
MASGNNKLELIFVVNGNPVPYEANVNQPLHAVLGAVLAAAGVAGEADKDRWDFKFNDAPLNPDAKIGDLGLKPGDKVFLHSKAGAVG